MYKIIAFHEMAGTDITTVIRRVNGAECIINFKQNDFFNGDNLGYCRQKYSIYQRQNRCRLLKQRPYRDVYNTLRPKY